MHKQTAWRFHVKHQGEKEQQGIAMRIKRIIRRIISKSDSDAFFNQSDYWLRKSYMISCDYWICGRLHHCKLNNFNTNCDNK